MIITNHYANEDEFLNETAEKLKNFITTHEYYLLNQGKFTTEVELTSDSSLAVRIIKDSKCLVGFSVEFVFINRLIELRVVTNLIQALELNKGSSYVRDYGAACLLAARFMSLAEDPHAWIQKRT